MSAYRWVIVPVLAMALQAAGHIEARAVEPGAPNRLIDKEYITLIAVRKELDAPAAPDLSLTKTNIEDLKSYYDTEEARLVWVDGQGLNQKAKDGLQTAFKRAIRSSSSRSP